MCSLLYHLLLPPKQTTAIMLPKVPKDTLLNTLKILQLKDAVSVSIPLQAILSNLVALFVPITEMDNVLLVLHNTLLPKPIFVFLVVLVLLLAVLVTMPPLTPITLTLPMLLLIPLPQCSLIHTLPSKHSPVLDKLLAKKTTTLLVTPVTKSLLAVLQWPNLVPISTALLAKPDITLTITINVLALAMLITQTLSNLKPVVLVFLLLFVLLVRLVTTLLVLPVLKVLLITPLLLIPSKIVINVWTTASAVLTKTLVPPVCQSITMVELNAINALLLLLKSLSLAVQLLNNTTLLVMVMIKELLPLILS